MRHAPTRLLFWGASVCAVLPGVVAAQDVLPPTTESATWSFQWENDLFAKGRNDRYYTNGLRLLYSRPARKLTDGGDDLMVGYGRLTGGWLCAWSDCERGEARVAVDTHGGQNMYTPQNLRRATYNPYDRPYAGWAYLGQRTRLFDAPDDDGDASRMQTLDIAVGIVGPSAKAGKVQEEWHHLVNAIDPQGWGTQLRDELGIVVSYTRTRRHVLTDRFDAIPYWRVTVGNVFTQAAVGAQLRIGRDLAGFGHFDPITPSGAPTAQSVMNVRPPGDERPKRKRDAPLYAFIAFEGRAVARNIFIDGNTWKDYPETSYISRRPLVGDFTVGFSAKVSKGTRITYGHTWRTKEFRNDRAPLPGTLRSETQRYGVFQFQWER